MQVLTNMLVLHKMAEDLAFVKSVIAKVRARASQALPEMLEDYILAAHASEVPDDKRKAVVELAKLTGGFADDGTGALPVINLTIGSTTVSATVSPADVVDAEDSEGAAPPPPALAKPEPKPIVFDLNFDSIAAPTGKGKRK